MAIVSLDVLQLPDFQKNDLSNYHFYEVNKKLTASKRFHV
jgi:hypothetical protein